MESVHQDVVRIDREHLLGDGRGTGEACAIQSEQKADAGTTEEGSQ